MDMSVATHTQVMNMINENRSDMERLEGEIVKAAIAGNVFAVTMLLSVVDVRTNAYQVIVNAKNEEVIEEVLSKLSYEVPRRLNACLRDIQDKGLLKYLLHHPRAKFMIRYHQSECIRIATLNGDVARLKIFMSASHVNVHSSGQNTMDKTSVQLAIIFGYKDVMFLFFSHGHDCTHGYYTEEMNRSVVQLQLEYRQEVLKGAHSLFNAVADDSIRSCEIYTGHLMSLFPGGSPRHRMLRTTTRLINSL